MCASHSFTHYTTDPSLSLQSDATRPPAGYRKPPIPAIPLRPRLPPPRDLPQPTFARLSKFLRFSPRTNAVRPGRKDEPRDPLDVSLFLWFLSVHLILLPQFPATLPLPLPSNRPRGGTSPSTLLPGGRAFFNPVQSSSDKGKQKAREPKRKTVKAVNVPLGQATYVCILQSHWVHEF
jgi:hypothetical protein